MASIERWVPRTGRLPPLAWQKREAAFQTSRRPLYHVHFTALAAVWTPGIKRTQFVCLFVCFSVTTHFFVIYFYLKTLHVGRLYRIRCSKSKTEQNHTHTHTRTRARSRTRQENINKDDAIFLTVISSVF